MDFRHLFIAAAAALSMTSCIQDEPLNAECDITEVTLPGDVLNRRPSISNDKVLLVVKNDVSLMSLAPEFELTPGATIEPASGTPLNFILPQKYTVTSQDKKWSKTYTVQVQKNNSISLDYDFSYVREISAIGGICRYDEFYEPGPTGQDALVWASANSAFALTLQGSTPNTFPTYQGIGGINGPEDKCVVLVTRSTGTFGKRAKKPIAAGNLFFGTFDGENAMSKPLQATHFGIPFNRVPSMLSGYYKYTPGETYCEADADGELVPVPGKTDVFNIYAVFFETTPGHEWLDGTNVLAEDNDMIIATAELPDRQPSDTWKAFSIPFVVRQGKTIDRDKLAQGKYSIAVVMSSSQDGDYFAGAVGSTLMVDAITVSCLE